MERIDFVRDRTPGQPKMVCALWTRQAQADTRGVVAAHVIAWTPSRRAAPLNVMKFQVNRGFR
jgi:hypothetical protein